MSHSKDPGSGLCLLAGHVMVIFLFCGPQTKSLITIINFDDNYI